jgi:hypothetical protein
MIAGVSVARPAAAAPAETEEVPNSTAEDAVATAVTASAARRAIVGLGTGRAIATVAGSSEK